MTIYEGTEQDKMNEVFDKGEDALKNGQSAAGLGSKISGLLGNSGVAGGLSIATTALSHIQDFVNNINVEKPEFEADNIKNATSYQGLENMSQMKMPNSMQANTKGFGEMAFHALKQSGEGVMSAFSTGPIGMIISGIMGGGIANVGDYLHNKRAREAADQYNWQVNNYQKDWAKAMNESKKNIENEMSFDMHRNTVHFAAGGGALDAGNGVTEFTTGGSHESNPYGGIQQGIASDGMPNYVEEGEVKWDKVNYIFPTRMKPTKKLLKDFVLKEKWHGKNYAEIAKIIQKTSEERENDPVARQTVDDMLGRLMQCHQEQKMQEEIKQMLTMIEAMPPEERAAFMQQMAGAAQNMYGAPQQPMPQAMPPQGMEQGMPMGEPQGMGIGYAPMQEEAAMPYDGEGVPMGIAACGGKLSHKFDKGGGANINPSGAAQLDPYLSALARVYGYNPASLIREFVYDSEKNPISWTGTYDTGEWNSENIDKIRALPSMVGYEGPIDYRHKKDIAAHMYDTDVYKNTDAYLFDDEHGYERQKEYINQHKNSKGLVAAFVKKGFIKGDKKTGKPEKDENGNLVFDNSRQKAFTEYFKKSRHDYDPGGMHDTGHNVERVDKKVYLDNGNVRDLEDENGYEADGQVFSWYNPVSGKNEYYQFYKPKAAEVKEEPEKPKDEKKPAEEEQKVTSENEQTPYPKYNPWPGFAKAGIALAGAFNRPDYEKANILQGWRPQPMDYEPIGDYQRFNPVDVNYLANQIGAQQNKMYDIMGNTTSPSRAAALLAQQYAGRNAAGDAYFQALEANRNEENRVRDFNRGTNQFNAQAANEAARVNFGLNQYGWDQTKAYADARDTASTLASTANSKAISSFGNNMGEAYKDWYNTKALEWMINNKVFPDVTTGTSKS
jgi:hypothetical protein